MKKTPLQEAIEKAHGQSALGRLLGISTQAVNQWGKVPAERCLEVEKHTGVSRYRLRPDIYGELPI